LTIRHPVEAVRPHINFSNFIATALQVACEHIVLYHLLRQTATKVYSRPDYWGGAVISLEWVFSAFLSGG